MICMSYDMFLCKELPFEGHNHCTCVKTFSVINFLNCDEFLKALIWRSSFIAVVCLKKVVLNICHWPDPPVDCWSQIGLKCTALCLVRLLYCSVPNACTLNVVLVRVFLLLWWIRSLSAVADICAWTLPFQCISSQSDGFQLHESVLLMQRSSLTHRGIAPGIHKLYRGTLSYDRLCYSHICAEKGR